MSRHVRMLSVLIATLAGARVEADEPPGQAVHAALARIAERYGLEMVVEKPRFPVSTLHGEIEGRQADREQVASYVPLLSAEWNLYPPELVRKTKLRRIVLCENLSFAGQRRTALPAFGRHELYLDVARGRHSELYVRRVIHHEFFHIIDWRDDGRLYADDEWAALNPEGFRYGTGGRTAQDDPTVSIADHTRRGFLNRYATTGVEEDKAEIFANMVVSGAQLEHRAERDDVIRAKMARMRELLSGYCSRMDDSFWLAAARVTRPEQ